MIDQQTLKSVEDLHRLKNEGVITADEFDKAKERLLFGPRPAAAPGFASVLRAGAGPAIAPPAADDQLGWALLPLRRYADFQGRSSRREYWTFQAAVAALFVLAVLSVASDGDGGGALSVLTIGSLGLIVLGLVVPLLALQVRRFHDQNRSGLFVLLNLVPYAGPVAVLVFMLLEGDPRENQFGPDPVVR